VSSEGRIRLFESEMNIVEDERTVSLKS